MERPQATVADQIARAVAATGVRHAYGHPGGEVVLLIDALRRAGVDFVLTHHENVAAFMASGEGELTGVAGVAISTLGPGATNMVTGAASALLERAPVLLFTGALARTAPAGTTHQALELNTLYAPVTKGSIAVTPENAKAAIGRAIASTTTTPHGPVHVSLPADVAGSPAVDGMEPGPGSHRGSHLRGASEPRALERARALIAGAQRPAIVVGLNALREGAADEVRALARATAAVVADLPKAKGVFPEDDPRFVGTLEMVGDELLVEFLRKADLVITAGVDVVEFDKPWRIDAPTIQVDVGEIDPTYLRSEVQVGGDLAASLAALMPDRPAAGWSDKDIAAHRAALEAFVRTDGPALQTWQVVRAVRAALPPDAIAVSDVGAHKMVIGQAWQATLPRTFFMANGLSSMGYSVPLAAAASLAAAARPAVSFVGDGGFSMYLGELETLVRLGLNLVIVVFVDGTLELIRRAQIRRKVPFVGTSFGNPDIDALGRAFGVTTHRVASLRELDEVLPRIVAGQGVRLLAAEIDGNDYRF